MDVNTTDNYSKTMVDYAYEKNRLSDLRLLAEKYDKDFFFDINKKGKTGKTID